MATIYLYRITKGANDGNVTWTECEGYQGPPVLLNNLNTSIIIEAQAGTVSAPAGSTIEIIGNGSSDCLGTGNVDPTTTTTTTTSTTTTTTTTSAPASFTLSYNNTSATTACNNYPASTSVYYARPGSNFVNSTQLFTNSSLTNKAPNGYYSNGSYYGIISFDGFVSNISTCVSATTTTTTTTAAPTTTTTTTAAPTTTTTTTTTGPTATVLVNNTSLDLPITGVEINGIPVTHFAGFNFPVNAGENGTFTTTQIGLCDIVVYYDAAIPGQNVEIFDSLSASQCCGAGGGAGICSFISATINTTTSVNINAVDGACA